MSQICSEDIKNSLEVIQSKFKSGIEVPVDAAIVTREEWEPIEAGIRVLLDIFSKQVSLTVTRATVSGNLIHGKEVTKEPKES